MRKKIYWNNKINYTSIVKDSIKAQGKNERYLFGIQRKLTSNSENSKNSDNSEIRNKMNLIWYIMFLNSFVR